MIKKHNWQRHLETGHGIKLNIERRVTPDYSDVEYKIAFENYLKTQIARYGFNFNKLPSDIKTLCYILDRIYGR
jgi:hypothetical protein